MTTEARHWDVAAYVLGVLDSQDTERFEMHLADCDACADEVESMLSVSSLLATIDPQDVLPKPAHRRLRSVRVPQLFLTLGRHHRESARRPSLVAIAATFLLIFVVGGSFFAGTRWGNAEAPASADTLRPSPWWTGAAGEARTLDTTDPVSGVHAMMLAESVPFGTRISMTLAGVKGPLRCELVVVDGAGKSTVVSSWLVPDPGYGVDGQPNPLNLATVTAARLADVARFEVRATDPAGAVTTLVTLAG